MKSADLKVLRGEKIILEHRRRFKDFLTKENFLILVKSWVLNELSDLKALRKASTHISANFKLFTSV